MGCSEDCESEGTGGGVGVGTLPGPSGDGRVTGSLEFMEKDNSVATIWDAAFPGKTGVQMEILGSPTKRVDLSWCEWTGCLGKDQGPRPWNRAGSGREPSLCGMWRLAGEGGVTPPSPPPTGAVALVRFSDPGPSKSRRDGQGTGHRTRSALLFQWLYYM